MEQTETKSDTHHGVKRKAQGDLENEQRLNKRLSLLSINQNGNFYFPVKPPLSGVQGSSENNGDVMQLDDTRYKTYIRDLDAELEDVDREAPDSVIFLPDIEKKLTKIPHSLLRGQPAPGGGNEMVLYSVPTSLSIPEEEDNVRKAIIEARARAREQQLRDADRGTSVNGATSSTYNIVKEHSGQSNLAGRALEIEDGDAMEIE